MPFKFIEVILFSNPKYDGLLNIGLKVFNRLSDAFLLKKPGADDVITYTSKLINNSRIMVKMPAIINRRPKRQ